MKIVDEQEDYVLFSTPMKIDETSDNIRILYRPEAEETAPQYDLIGTSSFDDHTGFPDRNVDPVEPGSSLEPLGTLKDLSSITALKNNTALQYKVTEPFIYDADMEITKNALPTGDYAVRFVVTDIFGNETRTDTVNCEWDGSSVVYEQEE